MRPLSCDELLLFEFCPLSGRAKKELDRLLGSRLSSLLLTAGVLWDDPAGLAPFDARPRLGARATVLLALMVNSLRRVPIELSSRFDWIVVKSRDGSSRDLPGAAGSMSRVSFCLDSPSETC